MRNKFYNIQKELYNFGDGKESFHVYKKVMEKSTFIKVILISDTT